MGRRGCCGACRARRADACTPQKPRSSHGRASGSPTGSRPKRSRIARSSRIAGGCSAPTDGKCARSGHSMRDDRRSSPVALVEHRHVDGAGIAPEAEQRRTGRPRARSRRSASRPSSRSTRGHGRWCLDALRPAIDVDERRHALSQQLRDVLEPGHQRRRQVDAGDEHQREMREHRHVGGLRLARSGRAARRTRWR